MWIFCYTSSRTWFCFTKKMLRHCVEPILRMKLILFRQKSHWRWVSPFLSSLLVVVVLHFGGNLSHTQICWQIWIFFNFLKKISICGLGRHLVMLEDFLVVMEWHFYPPPINPCFRCRPLLCVLMWCFTEFSNKVARDRYINSAVLCGPKSLPLKIQRRNEANYFCKKYLCGAYAQYMCCSARHFMPGKSLRNRIFYIHFQIYVRKAW